MDPRLLQLYNDELAYIREMGAEFARSFPKVAGRLGMESAEVADPYVERLLEGFAFLAARVQLKLQARFPDFTQHLLELVYPHFLSPIPSTTIVRFEPDPLAGRFEQGYVVPRGTKLLGQLASDAVTHCEFRTAHDVHLWPIEVSAVDYYTTPSQLSALNLPPLQDVKAALRLRLRTTNGIPFNKLALRALTFFLAGPGGIGAAVAEQLVADPRAIVARPVGRPPPWQETIPLSELRQCGLDDNFALLPAVPRSFDGYRLLQEYFALAERTLFIELSGLADAVGLSATDTLEIVFALGRAEPRLERHVGTHNIALFATPAINLFERQADRIHLSNQNYEHHLVVDRMRPLDFEVQSILEMSGKGERSEAGPVQFFPFYSISAHGREVQNNSYYTVRRQHRLLPEHQHLNGARTGYVGSETFLSLVDRRAAPNSVDISWLSVRCLCSNRHLPLLLPIGQNETDFTLEIGAPITATRCLSLPSRPRHSSASGDVAWKLISHLSLNYLSITNSNNNSHGGAEALRELLRLYVDPEDALAARQIDGIREIQSRPIDRRLPGGGQAAVARGTEISVILDEAAFEGVGIFPLTSVLNQFFARYVSINSFTEMVVSTLQRGKVMRWPTMLGRRTAL
ncbi:type VI secretion system baseplate subunit TssF [Rhizobium lentis]|uniref:Type VI secretion system protein ImpG n=1 Tax=Rhizobium binae TaxID=1138190 RepID=A0ABV2MRB7_9HYPH|nr:MULTISPECIES: type VI secretion system baseplate subunit TssF [Rhizobium]NKL51968.1 type VI secretion system baseplate subunit TssF [Rhizobium leguminosarum bv. viciae]MBX4996166.1 type VI secretion system baseplate subunit TssF [Rhizobium binae]MBX5020593.1 type VI secretion system baseplate subunit TssF [Rhizobium lentis]MBX5087235.1 type VI secretion system baseplate subunit TssF [Rhizobium lentis]MBX5099971.1 type VI secretion system baseplate subunit TssF [Rhizobium lentis]